MKLPISILCMAILSSCVSSDQVLDTSNNELIDFDAPYGCFYEYDNEDDSRPNFLVIGDSISIAYTPFVQEQFQDLEVIHNECNARWSTNGANKIDFWLSHRSSWEYITFNHGLWDAADFVGTSHEEYERSIRIVAQKVKAATNKPAFILTTGVPKTDTKGRHDYEIVALNNIAISVMNELNIPIIDLYSFSKTIEHLHVRSNDVHFVDQGAKLQAEYIKNQLDLIY